MAGDGHVPSAANSSPTERFASSSDDLQRKILEVEQQLEALSASKKSVRSGMARHSLPVGGHFSHRSLSQEPMTYTDFTLPKLSGQPNFVNVDRSASFEPTVGDDFVHNPQTGGWWASLLPLGGSGNRDSPWVNTVAFRLALKRRGELVGYLKF